MRRKATTTTTTEAMLLALIVVTLASCATNEELPADLMTRYPPRQAAALVGVQLDSVENVVVECQADRIANEDTDLGASVRLRLDYINRFAHVAQDEQMKYGVPASITLAQAVLETGGGTSWVSRVLRNHFGIKCKEGESYLETGCRPNPVDETAGDYAVYKTDWYSFRAHSKFLTERSRYAHILPKCGQDAECWAKELAAAGYSENESYAELLVGVINFYGLGRYDTKAMPAIEVNAGLPNAATANVNVNVSPRGEAKMPQGQYVWLLNPSHGSDTKGKRYRFERRLPNGEYTIYEYKLNRQIVRRVVQRCNELGLDYRLLVSEETDVPLKERVARANSLQKQHGNTVLLTFDHNAGGFDNEHSASISERYEYATGVASGMEAFHHTNALQMQHFLEVLGQNVEKRLPGWYDRGTKAKNFYTIRKSSMPATIMELGFFDNYKEACFLQSETYQSKITEAIVETMCYFSAVKYTPVSGV